MQLFDMLEHKQTFKECNMSQLLEQPNPDEVVIKSFNNACHKVGVSREQASMILGVDKATLSRNKYKGFDPDSKTGELCLQFIRAYRSLYAMAGGDYAFMQHWLNTNNKALSGKPVEMMESIVGLLRVNDYLDALRGRV